MPRVLQVFDYVIEMADLDLSEDAVQLPKSKKVVDRVIGVLNTRGGYRGDAILSVA